MDLQDNNTNKRKWKNRDVISSLEFALTGIFTAIKEERNMRNHAVSAVVVVLAGLIFQVSAIEWLFLFLSIFLVISFEIMNSAIENVVDLASDYHFSMRAKKCQGYGSWICFGCFRFCGYNRTNYFRSENLEFTFLT